MRTSTHSVHARSKTRQSWLLRVSSCAVVTSIVIAAIFAFTAGTNAAIQNISALEAKEKGITKSETAKGIVTPSYDESTKKDVLDLRYSIPAGGSAAAWLKGFPKELNAGVVNTVKVGVKATADQAEEVVVAVELKGSKSSQLIPVVVKNGWATAQKTIEWDTIGELAEVSFAVTLQENITSSFGTLSFMMDFVSRPVSGLAVATAKTAPVVVAAETVEKAIVAAPKAPVAAETKKVSFSILDAREKGITPDGAAKGSLTPSFDSAVDKDVVEVSYMMPAGSVLTAWAKDFPAVDVNAVKVGIRIPDAEQLANLTAKVVVTGSKGTQDIPLSLKQGWNAAFYSLDRATIGDFAEVALELGASADAKGSLSVALDFLNRAADKAAVEPDAFATYGILDAGEKGVFNIGDCSGTVAITFDENIEKDVWQFDYSLPIGSVVGVWSKGYPAGLNVAAADAVRLSVNVPDAAGLKQVAIKAELKGTNGVQTIPVGLNAGWTTMRELVNWNIIGDLQEVVYVVSPMKVMGLDETKPREGTVSFALDFGKLSFMEKYFTYIKIGTTAAVSALLAFLVACIVRMRKGAVSCACPCSALLMKLNRDIFYGIVIVAVLAVAMTIYSIGTVGALDAGINFSFLAIGLAGVAIAWFLKKGLTGQNLSAVEVFENMLVAGLLAAAASRFELLQAPATWGQVFMFSKTIAAITFVAYFIANSSSLISSGKHIKLVPGLLIVGVPYLFNWLLLVENSNLLQTIMNACTLGLLKAWPVVLVLAGRILVMFVFNEIFVGGVSFAINRKLIAERQAHLTMLYVAAGVILAPIVANLGSGTFVGGLPIVVRGIVSIIATMLSFAGLWSEVYLITGLLLDSGRRKAPSVESINTHVLTGLRKGMAYSAILLSLLYILALVLGFSFMQTIMTKMPIPVGIVAGALLFPLMKTIIESFDGSMPFVERLQYSYLNRVLCVRGAVVGFGFAYMVTTGMFQESNTVRIIFGAVIGIIASLGVSLVRDIFFATRRQGRVQTWRLYFVDAVMGMFVGGAMAFYLDALQVPVIVEKFKLYTTAGFDAVQYITYPLVNKWGRIDLGSYTGGAKLLFTESLAGVINWSIAAWLFAINKVFLQAFFDKDSSPIKTFFSREGMAQLMDHMIYVLRWGLWMSPIIFTFLRMMPTATWYNQDGAVRTLIATWNSMTMSPEGFQAWSLNMFVLVLAYDFFRVLIWMDHMGLRVATLVNLSFLGMDKLDECAAKFIGPAAAQRYIPEGVKRFTTWAPLLIPFYLPRGTDWDYCWGTAEAIQNAKSGGLLTTLQSLSLPQQVLVVIAAIAVCSGISAFFRALHRRGEKRRIKTYELTNRVYRLTARESGEAFGELTQKECDISRRAYDCMDPVGRVLFLVDAQQKPEHAERFWPVLGNYPSSKFAPVSLIKKDDACTFTSTMNGIKTTITMSLPDMDTPAEIWQITVENLTDKPRQLKAVPYLEWVLNGGLHDRFHTQYQRLYPEMEYISTMNTMVSWQKATKSMGFMAIDVAPEGFLTSRVDFIGRARSLWTSRSLETLKFLEARDTAPYPTFDPIGSFVVNMTVAPKSSQYLRMMVGYSKNKDGALKLVEQYVKPVGVKKPAVERPKHTNLIGHGEIPHGTPQPYFEYRDNGNKLLVKTPYTPRPFDHVMSNPIHAVMVTNRGLHVSCNGNSQQNRLTPDWADTVTKETPTEAIYLYDADTNEWFSPTHHPLNDFSAKNEVEYGVDGTATFHMSSKTVTTELTLFVPPEEPLGVYLLKIKNTSDRPRRLRVSPYFHMVLAFMPERSGPLQTKYEPALDALFFENPRNMFRKGWAFASMSLATERYETNRGRFFGKGRGPQHPYFVEKGRGDRAQLTDNGQIAAFLGTVDIAAKGECTVAIVLGQADTRTRARELVRKYKNLDAARQSLSYTQNWWLNMMKTVAVKTNTPAFDQFQNWLKYQALAERIWARRGFYQTSGAYGFRDQLQDSINLMWVDPSIARKQILLHASQQFVEGDVFHWFFTLTDGRTAFSCRSHASDNPLWLPWSVGEYINATNDYTILEEMTSYVMAEFPFAYLPKNKHGWGHMYGRTTRADTLYRHCMRSIDLILEKRMGRNGLPLMGTGDWNDGLDEIGSQGRGESVWLGLFLIYILKNMLTVIEKKDGAQRKEYYAKRMDAVKAAVETTWRDDRYLRAIHDDGTEIGLKDSGVWEIDALTAAWAVMAGVDFERSVTVFQTALRVLEKDNAILLGWPALREDTKPYLGRSSKYPEGVRENGMYSHGVQWLVKAARVLAEEFDKRGDQKHAAEYRETAYRLWSKIAPIMHTEGKEIELYGGQPNKQPADYLTMYDQGRMIWNGYTGAAGWMLREALEGVVGAYVKNNELVVPSDLDKPRGHLKIQQIARNIEPSPVKGLGAPVVR